MTDAPATLVELFERTAARHPHAPAVSDDRRTLTYSELGREADALAAALLAAGVGPEDRVAIHLPRGTWFVVAVLGILRAGAAYLAIDERYPAPRRDHMLADGRASAVVTTSGWRDRPARTATPVVLIDGAARRDGTPPRHRPSPANAACVIYTSGSTGRPKGVVLEHRQMVGFALDAALPGVGPGDRVAQAASVSFDTVTFEVWRTLAGGAEIVVTPSMPDLMGGDLQRELRRRRITAMLAPAVVLNHVTRHDRSAFGSLRVLCSGGDVLLPATCRELLAGGFAGRLFNLYGPTEATVACSGYEVTGPPPERVPVPIGTSLRGSRLRVLDGSLRPVPAGRSGQLYVGGGGVGRGYHGQPALTAQRFVADPFGPPGSRMYVTGDQVRVRSDGNLEFMGRVDDQLKINGYRVEPAEVERLLCAVPGVRDAAVLAVGEAGERRLVAFVVTVGDGLSPRRVRAALTGDAPAHLVPAQIIVLDGLPIDAHGKRDFGRLSEMVVEQAHRRAGRVPPSTATERALARIWEELLAVEDVGAQEDFFALGGHSLLAVRVRLALEREFGVRVTPEALFDQSVLADQAALIDRGRQAVAPS